MRPKLILLLVVAGSTGTCLGLLAAEAGADGPPPVLICTSQADCDALDGGDQAPSGPEEPTDPVDADADADGDEGPPPTTDTSPAPEPPTTTTTPVVPVPTTAATATTTAVTTVAAPPPPPDCSNTPDGKLPTDWRKLNDGSCQAIPDLCPNLPGPQEDLPSRTRINEGQCVHYDPNADVWVTESVTPNPVRVGDMVTFTITVGNRGEGEAPRVSLEKSVPAGLQILHRQDIANSNCDVQGGVGSQKLICDFPMLDVGETATVVVPVGAEAPGSLWSDAYATSGLRADPDMSNNHTGATAAVTVQATVAKALLATSDKTQRWETVQTQGLLWDGRRFRSLHEFVGWLAGNGGSMDRFKRFHPMAYHLLEAMG